MGHLPQAVFLDRDGVINKEVNDLHKIEEFTLIEGSADAIKLLNENNILALVVTNQPVVAKGFLTRDGLEAIHKKLKQQLEDRGAHLDEIFYCPHHPHKGYEGEVEELKIECECRKPGIGMFLAAEKKYDLNLADCFMVGDRTVDIEAGRRAGCKTILVKTGFAGKDKKIKVKPDIEAENLLEAVRMII